MERVENPILAKDMTRGKSLQVKQLNQSTWRGRLLIGLKQTPSSHCDHPASSLDHPFALGGHHKDVTPKVEKESDVSWLSPTQKAKKVESEKKQPRGKPKVQRVYRRRAVEPQKPSKSDDWKGLLPVEAPFVLRIAAYYCVGIRSTASDLSHNMQIESGLGLELSIGNFTDANPMADFKNALTTFGPVVFDDHHGFISFMVKGGPSVHEALHNLPVDPNQIPDIFV